MKQLFYPFIFCCLALLAMTSCDKDNEIDSIPMNAASNSIIVDFNSATLPVSRATATTPASGAEIAVDHLDVFIFDPASSGAKVHYERVENLPDKNGKAVLAAKRSSFIASKEYNVYVVANSTEPVATFQDPQFNLVRLKALTQEDTDIHMTGLKGLPVQVPQSFLMDGVAYLGTDEAKTAVVLNDGVASNNTDLKVTLRRAAAKIIVRINKGAKVTFGETLPTGSGYYLRNMPVTTSVISGVDATATLETPDPSSSSYFDWKAESVTVTAYTYAHDWTKSSALENEVRLIVNVPLTYEGKVYDRSYYQIPVSESKMLKRNTCYNVDVTLNAPGASNPSESQPLEEVKYTVAPWESKEISVGGDSDKPAYLSLNQYELEMHNMTDDNTTLEFASSSAVTAKITKVWYIDKFGQEKTLEYNDKTGKYGEKYTTGGSWFEPEKTHWKNECRITITPAKDITGNVHVHSDLPTNNTIRYIEFEVTNEESIHKKVVVSQYPLEYITNIQGWYSYRDDFKDKDANPTTYEHKGDRIYGISYSDNGKYEYQLSYDSYWGELNTSSGFWRSKVAIPNNDGRSTIRYYYYDSKGHRKELGAESNSNARMYHVRITATSGDYTLGRPRMNNDGYTDPGKDNAQMVSPSFMIASRLGFINSGAGGVEWDQAYALEVARKHCAQYVEVYKDKQGNKVVLDDWRLPTSAELQIIMKFQGGENTNADAIDYLLNGEYYWSASERVYNKKHNNSGSAIRCIRDAYDKKTGK